MISALERRGNGNPEQPFYFSLILINNNVSNYFGDNFSSIVFDIL